MSSSYKEFSVVAMAIDPIHVGTGGARLGRVELTIVRDPVTRVPKIPGSSLAGVYRSYVAMHFEEQRPSQRPKPYFPDCAERHIAESLGKACQSQRPKPYFPDCAGLGQPDHQGRGGHCGGPDCPVCVTFGFARGPGGGFAGLAAFSDAHVLLFPVPTREGPLWVTSPEQLRIAGIADKLDEVAQNGFYCKQGNTQPINLGWLLLERKALGSHNDLQQKLQGLGIPNYITKRFGILTDKLFSHVVNSNLEVRTSVSINPETGAAEEGALFSYEALPRTTILIWIITCRNPKHFKVGGEEIKAQINGKKIESSDQVQEVTKKAHPFLEHLGIGGMGTRGMGRLKVLQFTSAGVGVADSGSEEAAEQAGTATTGDGGAR